MRYPILIYVQKKVIASVLGSVVFVSTVAVLLYVLPTGLLHVAYVHAAAITGDANHDGRVTLSDFEAWRVAYTDNSPQPTVQPTPTPEVPRVTTIADGLRVPWALAFLPDGDLLFTERGGSVRIVKDGVLQQDPVAQLPNVAAIGEGGLLGMALHPSFSSNHYIYFYYAYSFSGGVTKNRLVRMSYVGGVLSDETILIDAIPGANIHNGGRIKFGPDGYLYIGTGDAAEPSQAQDTSSLAGKILRVTGDGVAAPGNPFGNRVYTYGHRNPQGLAWDDAGQLWASEHGQEGTDELNKIIAGKNYGWPTIVGDEQQSGMETPVANSGTDTWAPSGMSIIGSTAYIASLRGAAITAISLPNGTPVTQYLKNEYGRMRDVVIGPDGMMYVSTSNTSEDKILRINASKL